jgi:hypothetical protein
VGYVVCPEGWGVTMSYQDEAENSDSAVNPPSWDIREHDRIVDPVVTKSTMSWSGLLESSCLVCRLWQIQTSTVPPSTLISGKSTSNTFDVQ